MCTEDPNFGYLIETISNLARSIKNTQNQPTRHMLDQNTEAELSEHETVLFLPSHEFLEKLFVGATKPRIMTTLVKAYLHHSYKEDAITCKLWDTIKYGFDEYEHHKQRPFFYLFECLI